MLNDDKSTGKMSNFNFFRRFVISMSPITPREVIENITTDIPLQHSIHSRCTSRDGINTDASTQTSPTNPYSTSNSNRSQFRPPRTSFLPTHYRLSHNRIPNLSARNSSRGPPNTHRTPPETPPHAHCAHPNPQLQNRNQCQHESTLKHQPLMPLLPRKSLHLPHQHSQDR